ncbi:FluC/FEX family fluoride channel [Streptomyces albidus (ex Kaewkla and Franco 2022)]|uniref:fluoride efflux transporter FluC n=1 Tax=Streptomyces albidus (ex Kaewkla and Franco 2022) TaxID=722709 RepID=UPI0015EF33DE
MSDAPGGRDGPGDARRPPDDGGAGAPDPLAEEAVDPDVDLHVPAQRAEAAGRHGSVVLAVVAAGGALGAVARHALSLWLPPRGDAGFPVGVFLVNVLGCALIGVLMVLVSEGGRDARTHPLLRPFLGVGVLGGFTTFSAYAADAARLLEGGAHAALVGLAYIGGTLAGALAAVWAGAAGTRALLTRGPAPLQRREAP